MALTPKAVAGQIEGIASCLGPSPVELTLPLNTAKGPKLSFAAMAGDQVIFQDGIQLPRSPLSVALGGYAQLLPKVFVQWRQISCRYSLLHCMIVYLHKLSTSFMISKMISYKFRQYQYQNYILYHKKNNDIMYDIIA